MEITLPHKYQPRDYQIPLLKAIDNGVKRLIAVWHRRSGKDKTAINITIKQAMKKVGVYFYLFPTYNQGRKVLWDGIDKNGLPFLSHFPKELIESINNQEMKIKFKNGSLFQVVGTDNIDSVVGTNPIGCVFSEYSLQNPKAWNLIRPILAENGGWALFLYTPRGMNHGFTLLQQARESEKWFYQILTVEDTHAVDREVLEEERRQMPIELYEQEYYCKFLEGAGQFFKRIRENTWDGELGTEHNHTYRGGVDLAKYMDFTVLTPISLQTFKVGKQERFNQIDWNLQKAKIEAFSRRFNNARLTIDSTGVGDPIYEDLERMGVPVAPFKFNVTSRRQLLDNLRILLEQDKIKIPYDDELIAELQSMRFEMSEVGKLKLSVPEGLHDDRIMSLALAVWDLPSQHLSDPNNEALYEDGIDLYGRQNFD